MFAFTALKNIKYNPTQENKETIEQKFIPIDDIINNNKRELKILSNKYHIEYALNGMVQNALLQLLFGNSDIYMKKQK